ncbi:MAG: hypothetical protein SNJ77_03480 [Cytophagales bacterium]
MKTEFHLMPDNSRLWVHIFQNQLNQQQLEFLNSQTTQFCENWTAHEKPLNASFQILNNRVLVLAVDEANQSASGCSIDKSIKFLEEMSTQLQNPLLPKEEIVFIDNKKNLSSIKFTQIEQAIQENQIQPDSQIIPTWASDKKTWEQTLFKPLLETWLSRFLNKTTA